MDEIERKAAFLQGEPIKELLTKDAPRGSGRTEIARVIDSYFATFGNKANSPEFGLVVLDFKSAKNSLAHGSMNRYKNTAFFAVKEVIENGVTVARARHGDTDSIYVAAPVLIDHTEDIVTVLIHQDRNIQGKRTAPKSPSIPGPLNRGRADGLI